MQSRKLDDVKVKKRKSRARIELRCGGCKAGRCRKVGGLQLSRVVSRPVMSINKIVSSSGRGAPSPIHTGAGAGLGSRRLPKVGRDRGYLI